MNSTSASKTRHHFKTLINHLVEQSTVKVQSPLGVAVSGGSDSLALLHLLAEWASETRQQLKCCTVDHRLRPEAEEEADFVKAVCNKLGIHHTTLLWEDWDKKGNLQAEARNARRRLIADWATSEGVSTVALGHTQNDTLETFFMRLFRGGGVQGLSPMQSQFVVNNINWIRPIQNLTREQLRAYLTAKGQDWIDDPSNDDHRFERVKVRKALAALDDLDIDYTGVYDAMDKFDLANRALVRSTQEVARSAATVQRCGVVRLNRSALKSVDPEIIDRLLKHSLRYISGEVYPPRSAALQELKNGIKRGKTHSLSGCLVHSNNRETIEITREANAMPIGAANDEVYDGRWSIIGPYEVGLEIRPLGEAGLNQCLNWRDATFYSRTALLATPSIWRKDELIAAPFAGILNGWCCSLTRPVHEFFTSILTH